MAKMDTTVKALLRKHGINFRTNVYGMLVIPMAPITFRNHVAGSEHFRYFTRFLGKDNVYYRFNVGESFMMDVCKTGVRTSVISCFRGW